MLGEQLNTRRYDLDWLRVILFGILVPYHALIGFVSYGANVYGYRNQDIAGDTAEFIIYTLHAWRLPALFLISGVGTYFLMRNKGAFTFLRNRVVRILVPLIVCVVMWNAVIAYYQTFISFAVPSFPVFWWDRLSELTPQRAGHLWFLVNLFCYSVLCAPLFFTILNHKSKAAIRAIPFVAITIIVLSAILVKPQGTLLGEYINWNTITYAMYYILGFWCMTQPIHLWKRLSQFRYLTLALAVIGVSILGFYLLATQSNTDQMNLMINGRWLAQDWPRFSVKTTSYSLIYAANTLFWCMAIFGFGYRYLNRPNRALTELNRAVYPFYIFHMVVIFVGLYYLRFISWPWFLEFVILTFGTFAATAGLYLLSDRIRFLHPLVGLGPRKTKATQTG